jgi:TP901 family phage tail tape measure protein
MTDRTVRVRLEAVTSAYNAAMARAGQSTTAFARDATGAAKKTATELQNVQTEATIVGGSLLAMAGASVIASARFDKSMSGVQAVSGATADEMGRLRQAALDAGQATVFSASEAAQAEAELAKAGVKTADILSGALAGSLDLAAAGGLDLASSATIAAQAMNIFNLKGRDVAHIADVLAAGANKSAADVGQLGDALRQGGLVASQTGLSLEDTVGVLSAFADNALIGSDAGTSLKTMLQRLTPQSKEAADKMAELGINAYDAQGNFIGLDKFAQNLKDSMKDLTPEARAAAMGVIFGSDAVRASNVLYDLGEKGVRDYTKAVDDQGAASRMAATQLDNLAGDVEQLSGSIETTFIKSGSSANDLLREMTQAATGAVNFIGDLPAPILAAGVAAATAGGAFFIAAPRIAAFNASLAASPGLAKTAARSLKIIGPGLGLAVIAGVALDIAAANQEIHDLTIELDDLYKALDRDFDSSSIDTLRERIKKLREEVADPGVVSYFRAGIGIITGGIGEINQKADLLDTADAKLNKFTAVLGELRYALGVDSTRAMDLFSESGVGLSGTTADIVSKVQKYVDSTRAGGAASHEAAAGMDALADSTASAAETLDAYNQAWDATIGLLLGMSDAKIAAEAAIDDLTKKVKENGNTWDINTEKGRENRSAFNDVISAAGQVAAKKLEETGSVEKANEAYRKYLDKLVKAPGLTNAQRASIEKLISQGYDKLPESVVTEVTADISAAIGAIARIREFYATHSVSVDLRARYLDKGYSEVGGGTAGGGFVYGPGPSTRDSFLQPMANGEHVTRAAIAQANKPLMRAINDGRFASAEAYLAARSGGSGGTSVTYVTNVTSAPGEQAAESVPRAHQREAFLNGFGG